QSFTIRAMDSAGNLSQPVSSIFFTDTVAPAAPTISGFSNDSGTVGDGVTNATVLTLSGTADSGVSSLKVYDGEIFLGNATVNGGTWSFTTPTLTRGVHEFTAKAYDFAGNAS